MSDNKHELKKKIVHLVKLPNMNYSRKKNFHTCDVLTLYSRLRLISHIHESGATYKKDHVLIGEWSFAEATSRLILACRE